MGQLRRIKKHLLRTTMDVKTIQHRLGKTCLLSKIKLTSVVTKKKKNKGIK